MDKAVRRRDRYERAKPHNMPEETIDCVKYLWLKGTQKTRIANALKISRQWVSHLVVKYEDEWLEEQQKGG